MTAAAQFELHRPALTGHCYRMLGSVLDAEDAVQEAMLRAWKSRDSFAERSSVGTWLYRIATNVCLDMIDSRKRRYRAIDLEPSPTAVADDMQLRQHPREHWVEPIPDAMVIPAGDDFDPAERAILRENIRLAFVAALQHLPPRQRASLLLTQVVGLSAAETAEYLDMTVPAVNSALQRARATLAENGDTVTPHTLSGDQTELLSSYVDAFERYDVDALTSLMRDDVIMAMPPYDMWLQGQESIAKWLTTHGRGCRGSRLVPVDACGTPAFAQYRDGGATPWGIVVLDTQDGRITGWTTFLDVEMLFSRFALPMKLPMKSNA